MSRQELFDQFKITNSEDTLREWLQKMGVEQPDRFVLDHVRHVLGQPKSNYLLNAWNTNIREWSDLNTKNDQAFALTIFLELVKDVLENSTKKPPDEILAKVQNVATTLFNMEQGQRVTQVFGNNRDGIVVGGDPNEVSELMEHSIPDIPDFVKDIISGIMRR